MKSLTLPVAALLLLAARADVSVTEFASFDLPAAAVCTFVEGGTGLTDQASLLVTTFSPTTDADGVYHFLNPGDLKAGTTKNISYTIVDGDATWPNQADVRATKISNPHRALKIFKPTPLAAPSTHTTDQSFHPYSHPTQVSVFFTLRIRDECAS